MSPLPPEVDAKVEAYLAAVDAAVPGVVRDLLVVGSVAQGAYVRGRSDIDLLALVDEPLTDDQRTAIGAAQQRLRGRELWRATAHLRYPLVCNGTYLLRGDLARPWSEVRAQGEHVGREVVGGGDVPPILYKEAERAVVVRGRAPESIHSDDAGLRAWNRANLEGYWRPWAASARARRPRRALRIVTYLAVEWGPLGAPRLHHTIATGELCSKEQAGEYAKDVFDRRWHPVLDRALAYRRGHGLPLGYHPSALRESADFVEVVCDSVGGGRAAATG